MTSSKPKIILLNVMGDVYNSRQTGTVIAYQLAAGVGNPMPLKFGCADTVVVAAAVASSPDGSGGGCGIGGNVKGSRLGLYGP